MAVTATPVFVQTPNTKTTNELAVTTDTPILTIGTNGSKVTGIVLTNRSGGAVTVIIGIGITTTATVLNWKVNVPANAGFDGTTASVDAMNSTLVPGLPVDNDGQHYLLISAGSSLKAFASAGAAIQVTVIAADF